MSDHKTDGTSAIRQTAQYTLSDYRKWPGNERWELIHGVAYAMSPSPRVPHQRIVGRLYALLERFLEGKSCEVFISPIDVFPLDGKEARADDDDDTVVQPDIVVVCDPGTIQDDGIHGAPDLVVEILSDSTAYKDLTEKKALYETCGVSEYWIIKPLDGSVLAWRADGGRFAPVREYRGDEDVDSTVLPGFIWKSRKTPG